MAFGDVAEVVAVDSTSNTISVSATYSSATPAANDLNIACHYTGEADSGVSTSGFTEGQALTNATEDDEGAIYAQLASSGSDNTVTCTSNSATRENSVVLLLIRGAFENNTSDVEAASARDTASPTNTGASGGSTAQADEFMVALFITRHTGNPSDSQTAAWVREGTATPTSDMTDRASLAMTYNSGGSHSKRNCVATQVLTGTGTVGVSRAWTGNVNVAMIGYCTYKKQAAATTSAFPAWLRRSNRVLLAR